MYVPTFINIYDYIKPKNGNLFNNSKNQKGTTPKNNK